MLPLLLGLASVAAPQDRIPIVLDTDANNELDDQHAIAYMLFNGGVFDVVGITVNRTRFGGDAAEQAREAERVVALCDRAGRIPVLRGANGSYEEIAPRIKESPFDGEEAVRFIIDSAHRYGSPERKLLLAPIGKLTNVALALEADPSIAPKIRIVWLGSNYPEPGEYNLDNDEPAVNRVMNSNAELEIAVVRYGDPSGTYAVKATMEEIRRRMPGKGPRISNPIEGRNGGTFSSFGDYSVDLFEHIKLEGDPPSRSLYDMAALAIVKNPSWAKSMRIPAPHLVDGKWEDRPDNPRYVTFWEHFDSDAIMRDFYQTIEHYELAP
ncbi:MAG TPA: nucleoside hydrolase [Rhodothermales bacterium]